MSEQKLRIGHTGITWLNDDDYEDAIRTIAAEGFGGKSPRGVRLF